MSQLLKSLFTGCLVLFGCVAFSQNSYNISTITVTDTAGYLYDDGGPTDNYMLDSVYTFTINVGPGKEVKLQFLEFDVETNELSLPQLCIYDYLEIFDGVPGPVPTNTRYCGGGLPPTLTAANGVITVRWTADGAGTQKGFKAYWTTGNLQTPPASIYCDASGPVCSTGANPYILSIDVDGKMYRNDICTDDPLRNVAYSDYTDSIFNMTALTPSVATIQNDGGLGYETTDIYIDWNNDGTFDVPSEYYPGLISNLNEVTVAIVPPTGEANGYKRMRVRTYDQLLGLDIPAPCGEFSYGEVEDYTVLYVDLLNPPPACATGFVPADNATKVCQNTILRWNGQTDATSFKVSLRKTGGDTLLNDFVTTDTSINVTQYMELNQQYTWSVIPSADNGDAIGCDTLNFTTAANADPIASILPSSDSIEACMNTPFAVNGNFSLGTPGFKHSWTGTGATYLSNTNTVNPNFNGSAVGSYSLIYTITDTNNCKGFDTTKVNVISTANGGTIAKIGADTICAGTKVRFKVTGYQGIITIQDSLASGTTWTDLATTRINDSIFEVTVATADSYFFRSFAQGTNCSAIGNGKIKLVANPTPTQPILALIGNDTICEGQSMKMRVTNYSIDNTITWNTTPAIHNDTIVITKSGVYAATYTGGSCPATSSLITITVLANPVADIDYVGSLTSCANDLLVLYGDQKIGETITWSNGATTREISPASSGKYSFIIRNTFGCSSKSDTLTVKINPVPAKPVITQIGSSNPCLGEPVELKSTYTSGNKWSNTATTQSIVVYNSGDYSVTYKDGNGCISYSDTTTLVFRPAPVRPTIQIDGRTNSCIGDTVTLSVATPDIPTWNDVNQTYDYSLTTTESGAYFATYTNTDGCVVYSDTVAITFTQYQSNPTITVKGNLCEGNTVKLISSLEFGNNWDGDQVSTNDTIEVTQDGTFWIVNIQNGSCIAYSDTISITFEPRPIKPDVYEIGDSLYSSVVASTYQWISDKGLVPNSNHVSIKPKYTSNYRVIVYSEKGCASELSDKYYKGFTGIEEFALAGFELYPTPFTSSFTIDMNEGDKADYSITNSLGQRVGKGELRNGRNTITSDFAPGVYLLNIETDQNVVSIKIIKQ